MIRVYWHAWCGQDKARFNEITSRQYKLMNSSGLLAAGSVVLCIRADHVEYLDEEIQFSEKIKIFTAENTSFGEHSTYRILYSDLENGLIEDDDKIIYIHARGTSRAAEQHSTRCADAWTKCMENFVIRGWQTVDQVLDTYWTCGCELFHHSCGWHYSGNFWGARVDYLKNNTQAPDSSGRDEKGDRCAERWLLKSLHRGVGDAFNHYCLHATGTGYVPAINTYEVIYDESRYMTSTDWTQPGAELSKLLVDLEVNGFQRPGGTDKNTTHNFTGIYEYLLSKYTESEGRLLEIGVQHGGSSLLWHKYLPKFYLDLVDIQNIVPNSIWDRMDSEFYSFHLMDVVNPHTVKTLGVNQYDVIIDDGSHKIEHQQVVVKHYYPLLKEGGVLIIEDIQRPEYLDVLTSTLAEEDRDKVEVFDVRETRGRYDDLVWVVRK